MIIPVDQLKPETLTQVIREWLMRQGEDWGLESGALDEAIDRAREALARGRLVLHWDETEESLALVNPADLPPVSSPEE